jgi:hypothetical protein
MSLKNLRLILTLSCDGASRLISAQLDRDLSFAERLALRLHTIGCRSCPRFMRQLWLLRSWASQREESLIEAIPREGPQLSAEAKRRIRQVLRASGTDSR